jgi:hypothetical protein
METKPQRGKLLESEHTRASSRGKVPAVSPVGASTRPSMAARAARVKWTCRAGSTGSEVSIALEAQLEAQGLPVRGQFAVLALPQVDSAVVCHTVCQRSRSKPPQPWLVEVRRCARFRPFQPRPRRGAGGEVRIQAHVAEVAKTARESCHAMCYNPGCSLRASRHHPSPFEDALSCRNSTRNARPHPPGCGPFCLRRP